MIRYIQVVSSFIWLATFITFSFASGDIEPDWNIFKLKYSKKYENRIDDLTRMEIFKENKNKITEHNQQYEKGFVSYKMALNKFADWTTDELVKTSGSKIDQTTPADINNNGVNKTILDLFPYNRSDMVEIPASIDWRTTGAVSEIKDQMLCGSCWAFAATGALEGQYFRKTGELVSLSEQNILDCTAKYGIVKGCNGGFRYYAFQYVKDNGGIDTEQSYPYEGRDNNTCRFNPMNSVTTDRGMVDIPEGDEDALITALATIGPISISIDATHFSFRFYSYGIYFEPECVSQDINGHAVLAVGYGTDGDGKDYYIVKNSWGTSWGDAGYIKIARNKNNHCGVATSAIYPLV